MNKRAGYSMNAWLKRLIHGLSVSIAVAVLSFLIAGFNLDASPASVPIFYLSVVICAAIFSGRAAAIWASCLSFLAFNWFFVTPRYTFNVQNPSEWLALLMFLLTAIVVGQLMVLLKQRALEAKQHQKETAALWEASWAISSKLDSHSALNEVLKQIAKVLEVKSACIRIHESEKQASESDTERNEILICMQSREIDLNPRQKNLSANSFLNLDIKTGSQILARLELQLLNEEALSQAQKRTLDSLLSHAAVILERERLMRSQADAAALLDADRMKTALLSMVSHDFRSPLTSIKASASSLLTGDSPLDQETQRSLLQAIEQESDRLNLIVGNILDLSRLEAGAWKPRLEPVQLNELVGMVLDNFPPELDQRIIVKLNDAPKEIFVDSVQMTQVLKNLLENAVKYSPADSEIELECKTIPDNKLLIQIKDRGRGLSEYELQHIFEPFFRGKGLKESPIPGMGIGLALCRGLLESHNANLRAENRDGGGSVFSIELPNLNSTKTETKPTGELDEGPHH